MTADTSILVLKFDRAVARLEEFTILNHHREGDVEYERSYSRLHADVIQAFDAIEGLQTDLDSLKLKAKCLLWCDADLTILAGKSMAARMNRAIVLGLLGL